jgi:hypothetical protein
MCIAHSINTKLASHRSQKSTHSIIIKLTLKAQFLMTFQGGVLRFVGRFMMRCVVLILIQGKYYETKVYNHTRG